MSTNPELQQPHANLVACLLLAVLPLCIVGPSVLGSKQFLPFDIARFPPAVTTMSTDEVAAMKAHPSNLDATDTLAFLLPETELARQQIATGKFPAWNAGARFGAPLYANGLAGLTYPPHWLMLLAEEPRDAIGFLVWFALAVAGLGMFALLREFQLSTTSALFGGVAFAFCGTILANAHYSGRLGSLVWLPAMLFFAARMARSPERIGLRNGLGLAGCTALSWLAGFPPFAAIGTLVTAAFCATLVVQRWRLRDWAATLRLSNAFVGAVLLAFGFACVQLLPMFAFYPETSRDLAPSADAFAREAFDPMGFLGYVLPAPLSHPSPDYGPSSEASSMAHYLYSRKSWIDGRPLFPHNYDFAEYTVFPGTLVLLLSSVGLLTCFRFRFQRFAGLTLIVLGTLGVAPAFIAWVFEAPGMHSLQPMRWMGVACLFVAALGAIGLEAIARDTGRRRLFFATSVAAVLAIGCFWLAWFTAEDRVGLRSAIAEQYRPRLPHITPALVEQFLGESLQTGREWLHTQSLHAGIALLVAIPWLLVLPVFRRMRRGAGTFALLTTTITILQMWWFAAGVAVNTQPSSTDDPARRQTAIHAFLRKAHRKHAAQGGITIARAAKHAKVPIDLPIGSLYPDGIRDLQSFAFVDHWSHLLFAKTWGKGQLNRNYWPNAFPDDDRLQRPLLDLMGVRYLLSSEALAHAGERVGPELRGPGGEFFIYERPAPLPRAFVVHEIQQCADDSAIVDQLCATDFDPRRTVIVDADAARNLGKHGGTSAAVPRTVRFVVDEPERIVLSVEKGDAGYLVLADSFFSGWTVTVGGKPAEIARGNLFMRVVSIPSDACEVSFEYSPFELTAGIYLTIVSLLLTLVLCVKRLRRRHAVVESA